MSFSLTLQLDTMDCGPACLKMIAEYYGKKYSLEYLRQRSFLGHEGVSLLGISKAAEQIGLHSIGGRLSYELLSQKANLPCIVHWNQNHFVVLYKIRKNRVYIADPGKGLLEYSVEEFCQHWVSTRSKGEDKGVVLLLETTSRFYESESGTETPRSRVHFLLKYFQNYKQYFVQLSFGLLVGSILQLLFPFLTQSIVDTGIQAKDINFIWLILAAQLMLLFSIASINFIRTRLLLHISTRVNISLISDFLIKLMKLSMSFFDTKLLGDLLQRIEDYQRIERFLTLQTLNLLFSLFGFVIFGAVLFTYSLDIFCIFMLGTLLYAVWILLFLKRRRVLDYVRFEQEAHNHNVVYQLINGMQEIKLQGCEQLKRWEWEDIQAELFDTKMKCLSLQQYQEGGSIFVNEIKNVIITVIAATSVIKGEMTIGMMLAVQYIIGQLNSPVDQLMNFIFQWQDVSISLERMSDIQTKKEEENTERTIVSVPNNDIRIRELCFRYEGAREDFVLNDINLDIPSGKVTAIVGASGSGKTTLIKLLLGYYSPQKGTITVGGELLEHFSLTWWRKQCGAVMQDGYIFSDSIARNIAVSDTEPSTERLRSAAAVANIQEYIESLPLGYNTKIGQDGQGLSQGQKQRILIARAVYRNPQFIYFDEATNALDANNERAIAENLDLFYKNRTVIVVAHRLSTVRNADNIVVMNHGRIVEQGTHDELTALRGKYYELVKNQLELGN